MTVDRSRRGVLTGVGSLSTIAVAGCLGGGDDGSGSGSNGETGTGDSDNETSNGGEAGDETGNTDTEAATQIMNHPISREIDAWPARGPDPFEAPATLVVLDDPSCSRCAAFHRNAISELTANYVESGELSIAIRPYPVVYEWGQPAAQALEATMDRDEAVYWELLDHYFADQSTFDTDNVLDETESWLSENSELDATAVVEDVREDAFADRIEATLSAGEEAGAGSITPATFAFVDGEFQTLLNGSQSTETVETVLGL